MKTDVFLRKTRALAKRRGHRWEYDTRQGKGSHGTMYFGDKRFTLPGRRKDIRPGLLTAICRQLVVRIQHLIPLERDENCLNRKIEIRANRLM